jgi:capsule polysaccharide export protein KpsE/RkpR
MKGDTLVNNIQKRAASDAVKNLKTKLKAKDNSIKNTGSDMDDSRGSISHLWDIAGAELQSFK